MLFDAVVIGGGPAGATCARYLALNGLRVAVLEKGAPPRYKTCGGGLVWRARKLLEVDIGDAVECESFGADMYVQDAGLSFRVERPVPLVTLTMRSRLDQCLLDAACERGAELLAPQELRGLEQRTSEVRLETDHGRLRARFVVAADGVSSPTARAAGWPEQQVAMPALESEIRVLPEDHARFSARARFDFGVIPNGYAWVFPKREHLSVGCLSTPRGARRLRRAFDGYLARLGLDRPLSREDHGFVIPVRPRASVLARGRVFLAGDAAGLADPVAGEGITWALRSGQLAAEAIALHLSEPLAACREFQRGLAREILPELRRARLLAWMLYDLPRLRRAAFRRLGSSLCEAMGDVYAGEASYRSLLGRPHSYLRLARRLVRPPRAGRADL